MTEPPKEGEFFELEHYRVDARQSAELFATTHGRGFLLLSAEGPGLDVPTGPRKTMVISTVRDPSGRVWLPAEFQVWPIRKSNRSLIQRFVSVGRTRTNDVVVPDVSLSKFHAFFEEENGVFRLQDARSRNGTLVDGLRVPRQGEGPPMVVKSGSRVQFGAVDMLFLDASGLQKLVVQFGG